MSLTLTERQRLNNPRRYIKKDARTAVLRLIYGRSSNRSSMPHLTKEAWDQARLDIERLLPTAAWPAGRVAELMADFDRAHPHNNRQKAAA